MITVPTAKLEFHFRPFSLFFSSFFKLVFKNSIAPSSSHSCTYEFCPEHQGHCRMFVSSAILEKGSEKEIICRETELFEGHGRARPRTLASCYFGSLTEKCVGKIFWRNSYHRSSISIIFLSNIMFPLSLKSRNIHNFSEGF